MNQQIYNISNVKSKTDLGTQVHLWNYVHSIAVNKTIRVSKTLKIYKIMTQNTSVQCNKISFWKIKIDEPFGMVWTEPIIMNWKWASQNITTQTKCLVTLQIQMKADHSQMLNSGSRDFI